MKLIRSLGLVLCTCAALMGFTGVASASHILQNNSTPATLHGEQENFWAEGGVTIPQIEVGSSYVDYSTGVNWESPSEGIEEFRFSTSSISNGTWSNGALKMNNCRFEFQPGAADRFNIGPNGCEGATLTIGSCVVRIPAQAGLPGVYQSAGKPTTNENTITIRPKNVQYTSTNCGLWGIASSGNDLHLNFKWNVTETRVGENINEAIWFEPWAGEVPLQQSYCCGAEPGLFMSGETFSAQSFPVNVAGAPDATNPLRIEFVNEKHSGQCSGDTFSGGKLSGPVGELALVGTSASCEVSTVKSTFNFNGCNYAPKSPKPFESTRWHGEADLQCPAGKSAEFSIPGAECRVSIPAQHLSGTQTLENLGSGTGASIDASLNGEGLKYTRSGNGLICKALAPAEGSDLKLSEGIRLTGTAP